LVLAGTQRPTEDHRGDSSADPALGDYFEKNTKRMRYPSFASRACLWVRGLSKPHAKR
jgi:hypothetical protein